MKEVLSYDIVLRLDCTDCYLSLHSLFVICVYPERQAKGECIVNVYRDIVLELQLANEPLQAQDAFQILVVSNHDGKFRLPEVESLFVVQEWVSLLVNLGIFGFSFALARIGVLRCHSWQHRFCLELGVVDLSIKVP